MSEKIEVLEVKFKPEGNSIRLIPISCLHVGHKKYSQAKAQSYINYVNSTPDTYAIMLGDTIENVLPETAGRHKGSMHDQVMDVEKQRYAAAELLAPLADNKKILCWTESNHSIRSWYEAGFSVEQWIAEQLGVSFMGFDALLDVHVRKQHYNIHATHGTGGGTSLPSVLGRLIAQTQRVPGCDVYIRGHHHKKVLADDSIIDGQTGKVKDRLLSATGCFMEYVGSYGHRGGLPPVVPGCVKIKLYADKWEFRGTL